MLFRSDALTNNTSSNANITSNSGSVLYFGNTTPSVVVDYSIQRGANYKTGQLKIASNATAVKYSDTFVESANIGITLSVNMLGYVACVQYKTTNTGINANMKYSYTTVSWS